MEAAFQKAEIECFRWNLSFSDKVVDMHVAGRIRTLPTLEISPEIFPANSLFFCLDDEASSCLACMHLVHNLGPPTLTDG